MRPGGHTLLEVLAALAVLALAAGLALWALPARSGRAERAARAELEAGLEIGRALARAGGRSHFLELAPGEAGWCVLDPGGQPLADLAGALPPGLTIDEVRLEPRRPLRAGRVRFELRPDGGHAGLLLQIAAPEGRQLTWALLPGAARFLDARQAAAPAERDWLRRWL